MKSPTAAIVPHAASSTTAARLKFTDSEISSMIAPSRLARLNQTLFKCLETFAYAKMDHPMAKAMLNEVRQVLSLGPKNGWRPPIVLTEAVRGEGVDTLWEKIGEHRAWLESEGELEARRRRNLAAEVFGVASARARRHLEEAVAGSDELLRLLAEVQDRKLDPLTAVREILEKVFRIDDDDRAHTR